LDIALGWRVQWPMVGAQEPDAPSCTHRNVNVFGNRAQSRRLPLSGRLVRTLSPRGFEKTRMESFLRAKRMRNALWVRENWLGNSENPIGLTIVN